MPITDPTKAFYDAHADEFERKTRALVRVQWLKLFINKLPRHGKVLDLGCAYGRDAEIFSKRGFQVTGVDFSRTMIKKARARVPQATFRATDVRHMKFGPNSFDGIWALAILLHLPKRSIPGVLHTLHKILRPGGTLFIGTYLGKGEGLVKDVRYDNVSKYYSYFSAEEMKALLRQAGFSIVKFVPRRPDAYEMHNVLELIARKKNEK